MILKHSKLQLLLVLGLVCGFSTFGRTQSKPISLNEALDIARKNYAGLERDRLVFDQHNELANAGLPIQPTQIFLSAEEFGANSQTGIHSINVQQSFYLPVVGKSQKAFYAKGAVVAEKQLALTDHQLKRQVEQAYFQLYYAKQEQELIEDILNLYNDFLAYTTSQLEMGETGRIPQLAARSRLGQAQLESEHAVEKYQIALTLFNQWLGTDTLYDAQVDLAFESAYLPDTLIRNNPHLQVIEAQKELAFAKIESEKMQLLPQINSGFKLQTASGNFPLFGYQLGVNIPLFKKAYEGRIEAAKIGVKVQEADFKNKEQELTRTISELRFRLKHQLHILEYLQQTLTPIVDEQSQANTIAYKEGEMSYLEYLDGLEQVVKVKQQYLAAMYKFNVLRIDLNFWLGK